MFGDAEHYKYLTNEADLNNVGDDSMALTPKTPKKEESKLVATSPISPDDIHLSQQQQQQLQQQQQQHAKEPQTFVSSTSPDNVPINEPSPSGQDKLAKSTSQGKKINVTGGGSVGNISTESLDGSYYGYYNNKNLLEADNIPVESRPKQTG